MMGTIPTNISPRFCIVRMIALSRIKISSLRNFFTFLYHTILLGIERYHPKKFVLQVETLKLESHRKQRCTLTIY